MSSDTIVLARSFCPAIVLGRAQAACWLLLGDSKWFAARFTWSLGMPGSNRGIRISFERLILGKPRSRYPVPRSPSLKLVLPSDRPKLLAHLVMTGYAKFRLPLKMLVERYQTTHGYIGRIGIPGTCPPPVFFWELLSTPSWGAKLHYNSSPSSVSSLEGVNLYFLLLFFLPE